MIRKINKIIIALFIISVVSFLFYLNPDNITVRLGRSNEITAPAAIILISTFAAGFLFCAIFAFFFGLRSYWREMRLEDRQKRRDRSEKVILEAGGALAAEEWDQARSLWTSIVERDPGNILARIELSRSLQGEGKIKEAIKVLDAARAAEPTNPEVLFRAAELNLALQNSTAAIDNLALLLYHHPNIKAARIARDLSEGLDRIDDALQYQAMVEKYQGTQPDLSLSRQRLELKKLEIEHKDDQEKLKEALNKFVKKNSTFVPALYKLALMESEVGNTDEAARLLILASRHSGECQYWQEAAKIWIKTGQPDRAISAAKTGTADAKGQNKVKSQLELIKLYLKLDMFDDAKSEIDNFDAFLRKEGIAPDRATIRTILILKGRCYNALNLYQESAKIWEQLSDSNFKLERKIIKLDSARRDMPPARLSTP